MPDKDVFDVLRQQRMASARASYPNESEEQLRSHFPPELNRRYDVLIVPRSNAKTVAIREIHANRIGQLITLRAMVTRASDVKPLARVITYSCDTCGFETYKRPQPLTYQPLSGIK